MSIMDPIADLLTRIRNAQMAQHQTVTIPSSKMKNEIVRIMKEEGYLVDYETIPDGRQGTIRVELKYDSRGTPAISGMQRVSRQSRRVYRGKADLPNVLNGLGVTIVSTSRGVMTGETSRAKGVGGEVLCSVW